MSGHPTQELEVRKVYTLSCYQIFDVKFVWELNKKVTYGKILDKAKAQERVIEYKYERPISNWLWKTNVTQGQVHDQCHPEKYSSFQDCYSCYNSQNCNKCNLQLKLRKYQAHGTVSSPV